MTGCKFPKPREQSQRQHDENANRDVDGMQSCHGKVEPKENRGLPGIRAVPLEIDSGHKVFCKIRVVLISFQPHEDDAEKRGAQQKPDQFLALPQFRRSNRQRHERAAKEQNPRIDAAYQGLGMMTGGDKARGIKISIDAVGKKKSAKKQNFRRQKNPHPELRGAALLLEIVEVLGN